MHPRQAPDQVFQPHRFHQQRGGQVKTSLRENRQSGSTRRKVDVIVARMRARDRQVRRVSSKWMPVTIVKGAVIE